MAFFQGKRFNVFFGTKNTAANLPTSESPQGDNFEAEDLAQVYKQHADQLYKKGDYDNATILYAKTIPHLEPSYVIRKFLDTQRIHNLAGYLHELHKKGHANADHTTLLINCYAKLKDTEKLEQFIEGMDKSDSSAPNFDVKTAIKVLRQASFYDHALYLAAKYHCHDWYFKIQLEDKENAQDVLTYIDKLPSSNVAARYIIKYGRFLVEKEPDRTTELAKKLSKAVTGKASAKPSDDGIAEIIENLNENLDEHVDISLDDFLNIFVKNSSKMLEFLEYIIEVSPETATRGLYSTLLDLYLRSRRSTTDAVRKAQYESKILKLLQTPEADYDTEQAMVLCKMNSFDQGLLYLYQRLQLFHLICRYHMQNKDADMFVKCCEEFGDLKPSLWVDALWYFAENEGTNEQLIKVLQEIEKRKLLSATSVITILSKNPKATLSVVKDYLERFLSRETSLIAENEQLINKYKDDTEHMKQTIEDLQNKPKTFQTQKCSKCKQLLELPTVHFLCEHSFHQHCFESYSGEEQLDCPLCRDENKKLLDTIKSQENVKNLHEKFTEQLAQDDCDVITLISSYFSRGVFSRDPEQRSPGPRPGSMY